MIFLEVDPNVVKPGWTPLIITIVLAAVIVLLMLSMRRQMRKIDVPYREDIARGHAADDAEVPEDTGDVDDSASPDATGHPEGSSEDDDGKRVGHSG